ncbi:MAG: hypothetical protein OCD01_17080 [Fibrobacterales bacterium]
MDTLSIAERAKIKTLVQEGLQKDITKISDRLYENLDDWKEELCNLQEARIAIAEAEEQIVEIEKSYNNDDLLFAVSFGVSRNCIDIYELPESIFTTVQEFASTITKC